MYRAAVVLVQITIPAPTVINRVPPGIGVTIEINPSNNRRDPDIKMRIRMMKILLRLLVFSMIVN